MEEKKFKVHIYDYTTLIDRLLLNESQINLLNYLHKEELTTSDFRFEVITEEENYTDLT